MNTLKSVFLVAVGAAIGSAVTWKVLKTKYEMKAQEEINDVKDAFKQRLREIEGDADITEAPDEEEEENPYEPVALTVARDMKRQNLPGIFEYSETLKNEQYTDYTEVQTSMKFDEEGDSTMADGPYIISPEDFGENDDYDVISLTYYADGVLADDRDMPVDDVTAIVGRDFASHFGEYEDDSVFVRNDELKADYEILRDVRKYDHVVAINPHMSEDDEWN